jgi:hypothetical protein
MGKTRRSLRYLLRWLVYLAGGVLVARFGWQVVTGQAIDWEVVLVPVIAIAELASRKWATTPSEEETVSPLELTGLVFAVLAMARFIVHMLTGLDVGMGAVGIPTIVAFFVLARLKRFQTDTPH